MGSVGLSEFNISVQSLISSPAVGGTLLVQATVLVVSVVCFHSERHEHELTDWKLHCWF